MTPDEIRAEMRLAALEGLVCLLFAAIGARDGATPESVDGLRSTLSKIAREQAFPKLDPASSDFASAELEAAIDALLARQKHFVTILRE